jgi:hypothetical protein
VKHKPEIGLHKQRNPNQWPTTTVIRINNDEINKRVYPFDDFFGYKSFTLGLHITSRFIPASVLVIFAPLKFLASFALTL